MKVFVYNIKNGLSEFTVEKIEKSIFCGKLFGYGFKTKEKSIFIRLLLNYVGIGYFISAKKLNKNQIKKLQRFFEMAVK